MKKPDTSALAGRMREKLAGLWNALYRYHYIVGMQTARLCSRLGRFVRRATAPARRRLALFWRHAGQLPLHRQARRHRQFMRRLSCGWEELRQARREGLRHTAACFGGLCRRAVHRYRSELLGIWSVVGPAAACVVLLVTVLAWANTDFCLSLTYQGQQLGYIDNEVTYEQAAAMAKERVVNVDNSFSVEAVPTLAVTVQGRAPVLNNTELCDAILRTAGDSIAEATGLYINNEFIGAMESADELNGLLEGIKDGYYDRNDPNQRSEFVQPVNVIEGLFPALTVVDANTIRAKLTSEAVVEKTYTVQSGDTLSQIASKNDMTTAELRNMNPTFASTDMVHIGDVLTVQRPQPFLQVKVIKTIYYTEKINYNTQYQQNTSKPVTYSKVLTKGEEGSRDVVAEVTYLDGLESGRQIIQSTVTKEPVTQVIERGTQRVQSSSGVDVVIGDGKTTGTMIWPVPICHNMSRGFSSGHRGLDICNGPVTVRGKPAIAADGGKVIMAATGWNGGYGNVVKIQHSNGLITLYAHLQSIMVVNGQTVSQGQTVGLIGSTGNSTGPHLHFEVWRNGVRVNPLNYVSP